MAGWVLSQRFETGAGQIAWDRLGQGPPVVPEQVEDGHGEGSASRRATRPHAHDDHDELGASDRRPGQDLSRAAHGRRLADLLDLWDLERPAVVAHDIGGAATLRANLMHGRPMAALALVDVVALRPWGSPFFRLVRDHHAVFEQLPAAIHEGVVRAYVGTAQPAPLDRDVEDALVSPWLGPVGQSAFYRQIAQADERHTDEIEPLYGRVAAPTLAVWGERDPWIPAERGRELARRIPGARLEFLPAAGHLVQEDQPEELARLLAGHLGATLD